MYCPGTMTLTWQWMLQITWCWLANWEDWWAESMHMMYQLSGSNLGIYFSTAPFWLAKAADGVRNNFLYCGHLYTYLDCSQFLYFHSPATRPTARAPPTLISFTLQEIGPSLTSSSCAQRTTRRNGLGERGFILVQNDNSAFGILLRHFISSNTIPADKVNIAKNAELLVEPINTFYRKQKWAATGRFKWCEWSNSFLFPEETTNISNMDPK